MRLLAYKIDSHLCSAERVGAESADGRTLDLNLAFRLMLEHQHGLPTASAILIADAVVPPRMIDFIAAGEYCLTHARGAMEWAEASSQAETAWSLFAQGHRLPVLPNPPLLRDFMGFEEHLRNIYPRLGREIPPEWYNFPAFYKGNPGMLGAHGDDIAIPDYCENFDFEFEVAAVIGKAGVNITRETATSHIYGYTIYNDFSARDFQAREMSIGLGPAKGKDFDRGHVLGPVLVTRDEIEDVYGLDLEAKVNDASWCSTSTNTMHWRFEDMIAHASRNETLRIGEVFGSGTAGGGSGAERGKSLSRSDVVSLTVERIGTLTNRVV